MLDEILLGTAAFFALGSMAYVFMFRGEVQYDSLRQYLRKGWPIFAPMNCLLYMFSQRRARGAILDPALYPELEILRENWQVIRDEALALQAGAHLEATSQPGSPAYFDLGFRTFYKTGWRKFYLTWYGCTQPSAQRLCPQTVALVERIPSVNGAMFSFLPAGGQLTRHSDPAACSLRYHLGLRTPNDERCFINVDGVTYGWRDGEPLIFDETYLHFVRNDSDSDRLILMCDVDRPMTLFGRPINMVYRWLMRQTVVPNMEGDRRAPVNRLFAGLAPQLQRAKALKQTHRIRYRLLKYGVNALLLLILALLAWGVLALLAALFGLG